MRPVNPPNIKLNKNPIIKNNGVIKTKEPDHNVEIQLSILILVGIAIIEVEIVKYALVSISKPTINIWCPQTMHPNKAIINKAINMESLPNIIEAVNLDNNVRWIV